MRARLVSGFSFFVIACSSPPSRHPTPMDVLPPPSLEEPQHVLVPQKATKMLAIPDGPALCTVDDERLVAVWATREAVSIVGITQGRTVMHVVRSGKPRVDVVVDVVVPQPNDFALAIGESVMFAATDVKEWNESGPGIVDVTSPGGSIEVRGRKPGTNVVVFVRTDGTSRSVEFTVVGGERQVPAKGKPNPNAVVLAVGGWQMIPSGRDVRFYDVRPKGIVEAIISPDHVGIGVRAVQPGTAEIILVRDEGSESFPFIVVGNEAKP